MTGIFSANNYVTQSDKRIYHKVEMHHISDIYQLVWISLSLVVLTSRDLPGKNGI